MSRNFQYRISHLLAGSGFACFLAFVASFLEWSSETWFRNCFVLGFVACGAIISVGCVYVLVEGALRRRSRRPPGDVEVPTDVTKPEANARRIRFSKPPRRQTSAFKWLVASWPPANRETIAQHPFSNTSGVVQTAASLVHGWVIGAGLPL
jgi:hypothetical protein